MAKKDEEKAKRLAVALRDNLRKRKAQVLNAPSVPDAVPFVEKP